MCDDASQDSTYLVGLGYKQITGDLPLTVIRHPHNLGYGGNQRPAIALPSSTASTSSSCCTAMGSTRPSFWKRSSRRWNAANATPFWAHA